MMCVKPLLMCLGFVAASVGGTSCLPRERLEVSAESISMFEFQYFPRARRLGAQSLVSDCHSCHDMMMLGVPFIYMQPADDFMLFYFSTEGRKRMYFNHSWLASFLLC